MATDNFLGLDDYLTEGDLLGSGLGTYANSGAPGQPPFRSLGSTPAKPAVPNWFKAPGVSDPLSKGILDKLFGKESKPKTPYWQRLANREWAQGNAVLSAYESLYEPTLALARRSAADYGDLYRRAANESLAHKLKTQTTLRGGDLRDFQALGPEYIETLRRTNPALARLYDESLEEFELGDQLSASQRRNVAQSVRAGQAARGMGMGPSDVYEEAIQTSGYGDAIKQNRWQNLMGSLGLYGDVFQATTGRPAMSPAPQGANINAPQVGTSFDDLFSYGVNREIQSRNIDAAESAANKQMIGSIIQGLLSGAGAAAACWVAREVYGASSPRWRLFRHWLLTRAPVRLLRQYLRHGEAAAEWLRRHPSLKPKLREVMDAKIAECGGPIAPASSPGGEDTGEGGPLFHMAAEPI